MYNFDCAEVIIKDVFSKGSNIRPTNAWLEAGQAYIDDAHWINVTTTVSSFVLPIVLLSMYSYTTNDPTALRIRNKNFNALGQLSFQIKVFVAFVL